MRKKRLPKTDSIEALARFWDTHDLTDFEDELEEVSERVFERDTVVEVRLPTKDAKAVKRMAKSKGVDSPDLIRQWVLEKVKTP
ncbi:MAG: hypothetical protein HYS13_11635 [Planctomycetia bacterium]|nr:hypothetical protein [Planctomycetia bacterium]